MSRELPILFNGDMVQAILDGRKTVTRRVAKSIPVETHRIEPIQPFDGGNLKFECHWGGYMPDVPGFADGVTVVKPPYQPGDTIYVRETWCDDRQFTHDDTPGQYFYRADSMYPKNGDNVFLNVKWCPSIHMPKEATRIWLKVTDVRVERLKEISAIQAMDEGFVDWNDFVICWNSTFKKSDLDRYGWDANPWVWVIEFERCEKPEIL